ncbi:MAG: cardiolipin synthase [candidate division FCPU426 bacterium]
MNEALTLLFNLFYLYLLLTAVILLLDNREPSVTIAWLFVFLAFPVFGFILYMLFGRNWRHQRLQSRLTRQFEERKLFRSLAPLTRQQDRTTRQLSRKLASPHLARLAELLRRNSNSLLTTRNRVKIFHQGRDKFAALLKDLEQARRFIHLEYFIWRSDALTRQVHELLARKARAGVEVRILYDFLGSWRFRRRDRRFLRRAGVKLYAFLNFLAPFKLHTLNNRNHRKVAVIDGRIGYTGGMNLGQEYVDGGRRFPAWRDTHLRLEGEAASVLTAIFAVDWHNTTGEELFQKRYFPAPDAGRALPYAPLQVTTSGPDSEWPSIKQLFFQLITSAEKRVYLQTPYFIPDPSVHMALKTAGLSGVDVRIMVAGLPDKRLPFWSAFTFFEELLKAGVRIYHYQHGFLHAKTLAVDSRLASAGTANFDIRSFHLNYELSNLLYDPRLARELEGQFLRDLRRCREFTLADYQRLGYARRLRNSLARLLAPLQ